MIELTLPYPPSVNHYKTMGRLKTSKAGNMYREMINSPQTLKFYCDVMNICRAKGVKSLDSKEIVLIVQVFPPDKRKRDLSNILKVLEDSLVKGGCFEDDSQICRLVVERCYIIKHGQIIVRIMPL